jgi:hypothetical protein
VIELAGVPRLCLGISTRRGGPIRAFGYRRNWQSRCREVCRVGTIAGTGLLMLGGAWVSLGLIYCSGDAALRRKATCNPPVERPKMGRCAAQLSLPRH